MRKNDDFRRALSTLLVSIKKKQPTIKMSRRKIIKTIRRTNLHPTLLDLKGIKHNKSFQKCDIRDPSQGDCPSADSECHKCHEVGHFKKNVQTELGGKHRGWESPECDKIMDGQITSTETIANVLNNGTSMTTDHIFGSKDSFISYTPKGSIWRNRDITERTTTFKSSLIPEGLGKVVTVEVQRK